MKKLVLGSQSPRRKELLSAMGFDFTVRVKHTDESYPEDLDPDSIAIYIAKKKSEALFSDLEKDEILICADTIVVFNGEIMGKPHDAADAIKMLTKLSGNRHEVITGVTLVSRQKVHSFSETTAVYFKNISASEIEKYVSEFNPLDKAGASGIQKWIGHIGIEKIEGSYENVVGLPTARLYSELKEFEK